MGCVASICFEEEKRINEGRVRSLEEKIRVMKYTKEKEIEVYEQHYMEMLFLKEMERKNKYPKEIKMEGSSCSYCHGRSQYVVAVEEARRDDAVEKWKQLYLTIKTELDDLIHRTDIGQGTGGSLFWRNEEDDDATIQALEEELKVKENTIEVLRLRMSTMERERTKLEREFDILKQSLRILNASRIHVTDRKISSKHHVW